MPLPPDVVIPEGVCQRGSVATRSGGQAFVHPAFDGLVLSPAEVFSILDIR